MGGLYIHIPFCRQACRYCDFYFTVSLRYLDEFVRCLLLEIAHRAGEAGSRELGSLYFGGGTPSVLPSAALDRILDEVQRHFHLAADAEITMEANPDDLDPERLSVLRASGINRLSIGIQSFREEDLQLMRRSHDARQARQILLLAAEAGFENLSADLIYGIPGQDSGHWLQNLEVIRELPLSHLSAYHLTFEEGTVFDHWRKKGRLQQIPEEKSEEMYRLLTSFCREAGFEHYEISNFAREKKYSRHNLLYWSGRPYLGLGPSAHSFGGKSRSWNPASLKSYMKEVGEGRFGREEEILDSRDRYHEYVITSLRTRAGCDPGYMGTAMGENFREHFLREARRLEDRGLLAEEGGLYRIPEEHWILADHIMRELFIA